MAQAKKLIEVAMPIKEISAESVRDKSIRHGHISTLHLWWARRPLPVCRAVTFASLVPDPLDENCPKSFKDAVDILLGKTANQGDPYKPYDDIPYTVAADRMEDTLRNRLMMFIGKFSNKYSNLKEKTGLKNILSEFSLIKWENKDNESLLNIARKLIWVAYNSHTGLDADVLINEFDKYYSAIKHAEFELYDTTNRHIESESILQKDSKLSLAIDTFLDKMPKVFDPFAGGGAIPLEMARLGCRSFGNDINPVAHIVQKGSVEYPQKFGKPIKYSNSEFKNIYGINEFKNVSNELKVYENGIAIGVRIENRLAFDVDFYGKQLISLVNKQVGHYYHPNKDGSKPIVYYWVRVGTCSNPSCKANVPLLRQFYLSKRRGMPESKWIYLNPKIANKEITFEIKSGSYDFEPWLDRATLKCPICGSVTETKVLKQQFVRKLTSERLVAVIEDTNHGKFFRIPQPYDITSITNIPKVERPHELMPQNDSQNLKIPLWGFKSFGEMFSDRQILVMQAFVDQLNVLREQLYGRKDYSVAVLTYLAMLIDRLAMRYTTFNTWHIQQDTVEKIMSKQAIPMVFDYPEMNPFSSYTSSAYSQLEQIVAYIKEESSGFNYALCQNAASGDRTQFKENYLDAVITDPPYYDAIAYADLSDFFYVWLKRTIGKDYTLNFATPNTPKTEECTAIKHNHQGNRELAKVHFESKLLEIFDAIEYQTSGIVSIMFAHQSTEAWTTLCNSILGARMNITGSWAVDTEATGGLKEGKSYLSSSVTVACIPTKREGNGDYKTVRNAIEQKVIKEVNDLYRLGFRGADLLTACFGQAVSEFGKYSNVEKADGSVVTVGELLEIARESAFNALLKGFDGDDFTKFYIGWLQLYGFTESDFDDAAKFSRVGLTINVSEIFSHYLFIKKGNKQELAGYKDRLSRNRKIGDGSQSLIIDNVHKAMALYEGANRNTLIEYIAKVAISPDSSFWRVITSLCEVVPQGTDDLKQATGLISNKDSLIRESKNLKQQIGTQRELF